MPFNRKYYITADIILERYLVASDLFRDVFQNHHILLGIVLGYGRHNAQLFSRKVQIEEEKESSFFFPINIEALPAKGFSSLEEEYQDSNDRLISFEEEDLWEWWDPVLPLPGFIADSKAPETQKLKEQYRKQRKKMIEIYKERHFLETTLEVLVYDF